jgi:signal transduction histidine kinase
MRYQEAIAQGMAEFRITGQGPVVGRTQRLLARHRDGSELPIELSISSVRIQDRWHAIGTVRDVSERERAEEALKASRRQARRLATHLQRIREEERRSMAREIHDELGHALTALKFDLVRLQRKLDPEQHELQALVSTLLGTTSGAVAMVQRLSAELRPAVLDDLGLVAAVEWLAGQFQEKTGIGCTLAMPTEEPVLNEERSTALFRIIQEALTNIARHAGATTAAISLARSGDGCWTVTISDDGRGVSEQEAHGPDALGLLGMRERAYALGGELRIQGAPGKGTTVSVSIPLDGKDKQ